MGRSMPISEQLAIISPLHLSSSSSSSSSSCSSSFSFFSTVEEKKDFAIPPGHNGVGGVLSHGGKFAEYNVFGNVFHVTSKYRPPLIPIGRGAYGVVCSAFNMETGKGVAIKKIPNAFDNRTDAIRTWRELHLLRHLKHENIIAIKDIIPPPSKRDLNDVYIVYELMDTDLQQVMRLGQALTEDHCKYFLYQILRGLKYIHSANVLHRDLKPSNLLINSNCDLKICDFGMARLDSPDADFMTEYVVTRWYRPPELLLNTTDYTTSIDIWSVGCIYVELLTGRPLFPGRDYAHQLRCILGVNGTPQDSDLDFVKSENARRYMKNLPKIERQALEVKFPQISSLAIDLIQKMLTFNPAKRITAKEALAHPYLSNLHDESDEPICTQPFSMDFDEASITDQNHIKDLIYNEALRMNPKFTA